MVLGALLKFAFYTQFQPLFQLRRFVPVCLLFVKPLAIQLFTFCAFEFRILFPERLLGSQQFQQFWH